MTDAGPLKVFGGSEAVGRSRQRFAQNSICVERLDGFADSSYLYVAAAKEQARRFVRHFSVEKQGAAGPKLCRTGMIGNDLRCTCSGMLKTDEPPALALRSVDADIAGVVKQIEPGVAGRWMNRWQVPGKDALSNAKLVDEGNLAGKRRPRAHVQIQSDIRRLALSKTREALQAAIDPLEWLVTVSIEYDKSIVEFGIAGKEALTRVGDPGVGGQAIGHFEKWAKGLRVYPMRDNTDSRADCERLQCLVQQVTGLRCERYQMIRPGEVGHDRRGQ